MKYFIHSLFIISVLFTGISSAQGYDNLKEEAEKHLSEGKLGEAIDLLNKYISAHPDRADGYHLRGIAYKLRTNFEAAVRDFTSALKLQPRNKEIKDELDQAREAWNKLLVNRIEGYKREIAKDPVHPKNYLEIGKSYNNLEDWPSAEMWYDEYLKREEASPDEILRYTEILARNKKYRKGEPVLKRYTLMFPADHRLWSRYGYFNLWMGNKKKAIEAFDEALRIRPFFKESMEGLDQAKGKGYNFTYTSPKKKGDEYLIDKLLTELKYNSGDNNLRLRLIRELMLKKRFEEAYQQLQIIRPDSSLIDEFNDLWNTVLEKRKINHIDKINELLTLHSKDSANKEILLQLARRYSYIEEYDSSVIFYSRYLKISPGDLPVRFEYAKVLAWNLDYNGSREQVILLLNLDPENKEYQLLFSTLSVWMLQDLKKAGEYLENILAADPNNFEALIIAASLNIQNKNFSIAEDMLHRAKRLDPENERIAKLESDLDFHKLRAEEEKNFLKLEEGRVLALNNKCKEALIFYEEYLSQTSPGRMVLREYADVLACAGDFRKAIDIYNDLLNSEYDFETDLQRAKVFYWSGDSLNALKEFTRLYASYPDNFDVRMYLGDTYTQLKLYTDARNIYNNLLASKLDSSQSELINMRIGWLPAGRAGFGVFPDYMMLSPNGLFYEDNLGFTYNSQSIRFDMGLTSFLTLAPEVSFGFLKSDFIRKSFNTYKGNFLLKLAERITAGGGYGLMIFSQYDENVILDAFIKYEEPDKYHASLSFLNHHAAIILFSPELVNRQIYSTLYRLTGNYRFESGIKLSGNLSRIEVSDNRGHSLEAEGGIYITRRLYTGYEFYNLTFEKTIGLYFSPANYSSHSITSEFDLLSEKNNKLTLGGKIGIISNSDYILKEIYAGGIYSLTNNLALQGRAGYGSSLQNDIGYSFFSVQLAAYWIF